VGFEKSKKPRKLKGISMAIEKDDILSFGIPSLALILFTTLFFYLLDAEAAKIRQETSLGAEIKNAVYEWAIKHGEKERGIALGYNTCLANSTNDTQMSMSECLQITGNEDLISKIVDVVKNSKVSTSIKVDFVGDDLFKQKKAP
jgi:hypothetical protein